MSEQGEQGEPDERDGGGSGGDGRADAGRSDSAARGGGGGAGDSGGRGESRGPGESGVSGWRILFPSPTRLAVGVLGPLLLTTAYFILPFEVIGPDHPVLAWVVLVGILVLLAIGMVVTTSRTLAAQPGRFRHPGVAILIMSWAATLAFSASYWAMATRHGEFVGLQTRLDALYFTGVTMATVGYGDIHPSGQLGRAVVLVQIVYTFTFLVGGITAIRTRTRARMMDRMSGGK